MAPPTLTSLGSARQAPPKPATVDQEETPVQPKRCGHPPKAGKFYVFLGSFLLLLFTYDCVLAPVVFKNPVIFDKK